MAHGRRRRQTIESLEKVADAYRNDPEHGAWVRHFEHLLRTIAIERNKIAQKKNSDAKPGEGEPWKSVPTSDAIRWQLEENGTWTEVGKLASHLHLRGVESKATINKRVSLRPQRRQLSNFERLKRAVMAEVRNRKLAAALKDDVVFVGLSGWHIPQGMKPYQQRWTKGVGKKRH